MKACSFLLEKQPVLVHQLQAVKNNAVFVTDYDFFTQPSHGTLTDGIELLAALFHPEIFTVPERLQHKYSLVTESSYHHV